jgi:hypothetical protein
MADAITFAGIEERGIVLQNTMMRRRFRANPVRTPGAFRPWTNTLRAS